jgi:mono/diheme cytochrome c family protein
MKKIIITSLSITLFFMACKSTKNTASTNAPTLSKTGIIVPTSVQLDAIKSSYANATLEELTSGHQIYTGVCTNCHGAKSIYRIAESKWQGIIDDMSHQAKLEANQKDALTKYVFSIKATQPK